MGLLRGRLNSGFFRASKPDAGGYCVCNTLHALVVGLTYTPIYCGYCFRYTRSGVNFECIYALHGMLCSQRLSIGL